jgi:hypothetical protein
MYLQVVLPDQPLRKDEFIVSVVLQSPPKLNYAESVVALSSSPTIILSSSSQVLLQIASPHDPEA